MCDEDFCVSPASFPSGGVSDQRPAGGITRFHFENSAYVACIAASVTLITPFYPSRTCSQHIKSLARDLSFEGV